MKSNGIARLQWKNVAKAKDYKDADTSLAPVAKSNAKSSKSKSDVKSKSKSNAKCKCKCKPSSKSTSTDFPPSIFDDDAVSDPSEPAYLAQKIRSLIDAQSNSTSTSTKILPTNKRPASTLPARAADGSPIVPEGAMPISDARLISFLSSPTIMNGGKTGKTERDSVWSFLESFTGPTTAGASADLTGSGSAGRCASIMMYSPLVPTESSIVELAQTRVRVSGSAGFSGTSVPRGLAAAEASSKSHWYSKIWPFSHWAKKNSGTDSDSKEETGDGTDGKTETDGDGEQAEEETVWVPSTTKISFHASWWGYRM